MKKLLYMVLLALPLAFTACSNDDVDGPSESGLGVEFPQGNNAYDQEFVQFKNNYGTMVLYRFTDAQFRWAVTEYIPYYGNSADEAYVQQAWDLIKADLSLWPDEDLKKWLPYQIFLCDSVWKLDNGSWNSETQKYNRVKTPRNSCYGYNHLAFGFANASVASLTAEQKKEIVGDVAYALIGYAASKGKLAIPADFQTLFTDSKNYYATYMSTYFGGWGYNAAGTLDGSAAIDNYTVYHDFATFVKYMVTMSPEAFEAKYLDESFDNGAEWSNAENAYVAQYRVKRKYESVKTFFKDELGIDLGAMGTKTEQTYK